MKFATRLSKASLFVTYLALMLISFTTMFLVFRLVRGVGGPDQQIWYLLSLALVVVVITVSWGLAPTHYKLTEQALVIVRPFGNLRIPYSQFKTVQELNEGERSKGWLRTFGNGGLFGFYGWFRHAYLGTVKMQVRNFDHLLLLHTHDRGTYGLSTHDTRFPELLRERIKKS